MKKIKRLVVCVCMALLVVMNVTLGMTASASEVNIIGSSEMIVTRATGKFSMSVPANTLRKADTSFPMESGETVTINAVYSPSSAKMEFGLIGPDGRFHYFTVSNGSIQRTIKITTRGNYTLAVKNNSAKEVDVSGYVNF